MFVRRGSGAGVTMKMSVPGWSLVPVFPRHRSLDSVLPGVVLEFRRNPGPFIRPVTRFCPPCLCSGPLPARYCHLWEPSSITIRIHRRYALSRKDDLDNRANLLNPNNDAYWESRGFDGRPDDWEDRIAEDDDQPERKGRETSPRK